MSRTIFVCVHCEAEVTRPLERLEDMTQLRTAVGDNYYDPPRLIPAGCYALSDTLVAAGIDLESVSFIASGEVLFNSDDLCDQHPTLQNTKDRGCCGYGGNMGCNWFCINGHAIGTEVSDCCMVNYCRFSLTELREIVLE